MGKNPGPRAAPGAPLLLVRQKSFIASLLPGAPSHRIEAEGFFLPPPPICVPALWSLCRWGCAEDTPEFVLCFAGRSDFLPQKRQSYALTHSKRIGAYR